MKKIFGILLVLYACVIISYMYFTPKYITGDGKEYWAMTEALQNGTVAVDDDILINKYANVMKATGQKSTGYQGFYEANDGKFYSYHFWLYPLFLVPFKIIAEALNAPVLFEFYSSNLFFLLLMLFIVYKFPPLNWNVKQKYFAIGVLAFSPVVPYVLWNHPEVFATALVVISLCFYMRNNLYLAVLFSGMAASQNPPIGLFTLFCGSLYLLQIIKQKKIVWRDFFVMGLCAIPLVLSPLFYYVKFGTFNLIQKLGYSDWNQISFGRFFSFWLDINQGMVVCALVLVIIFVCTICKNLYYRNLKYFSFVVLSFLMVILASTTTNWNHGQVVLSRYTTWIYPFMIFYVVSFWQFTGKKSTIVAILTVLSVLFQLLVGLLFGSGPIDMKPWANKLLEYCPQCYNPDTSVFMERSQRIGSSYVFWDENFEVIKILTSYNIFMQEKDKYDIWDKTWFNKKLQDMSKKPEKMMYINPPKGVLFVNNITYSQDDLYTSVGLKKNGKFITQAKSGYLVYGPYKTLKKGNYVLNIVGNFRNIAGAFLDMSVKGGKKNVFKQKLADMVKTNDGLITNVKLTDDLHGMEIRVYVDEDSDIDFIKYKLEKGNPDNGLNLVWKADANDVISKDGVIVDGKLVNASNNGGVLFFGPYKPLKKGEYLLMINGDFSQGIGAVLDIVGDKGNRTFFKYVLNNNEPTYLISFDLDTDIEDAEIRLSVKNGQKVMFNEYQLLRMD